MISDTYWVRTIVGDALAKHRSRQFAVNILRVQVFIFAVEEQSCGIGADEVRESLTDHRETEYWTVLSYDNSDSNNHKTAAAAAATATATATTTTTTTTSLSYTFKLLLQ